MNGKNYYTIISSEISDEVLLRGLYPQDGILKVFLIPSIADGIFQEYGVSDLYTILEIDHFGISGSLLFDDSAKKSAPFRFLLKQDFIDSKFISLYIK